MTGAEREAVERLTRLADGWEMAAEAESKIEEAFAGLLERFGKRFDEGEREFSGRDLQRIRVALEARDNRRKFEGDAAATRLILARLSAASKGK